MMHKQADHRADYIDNGKAIKYLRRAYDAYATETGWAPLAPVRDSVDIVREQIDEILTNLFLAGEIGLIAEVNRKALTQEDRDAAVYAGGEDKHLVRWRS